jgi:hypothetical protein
MQKMSIANINNLVKANYTIVLSPRMEKIPKKIILTKQKVT